MGLAAKFTFEGLVPSDSVGDVPTLYSGLYWSNAGVVGRAYLDSRYQDDGYHSALSGDVVGWARPINTLQSEVMIIAPEGSLFTLSKGDFASAWNVGQTLTFTAYKNGLQKGVLTVTVDNVAQTIEFGRAFKNIDVLVVLGAGGEAADPEGFGSSPIFAFDNLKVSIKALATAPDHFSETAAAREIEMNSMDLAWQSHDSSWYL